MGSFSISAAPAAWLPIRRKLESAIDKEIAAPARQGRRLPGNWPMPRRALAADAIKGARQSARVRRKSSGSGLATGSTLAQVQSWPERIAAVGAEDVLRAAKGRAPIQGQQRDRHSPAREPAGVPLGAGARCPHQQSPRAPPSNEPPNRRHRHCLSRLPSRSTRPATAAVERVGQRGPASKPG